MKFGNKIQQTLLVSVILMISVSLAGCAQVAETTARISLAESEILIFYKLDPRLLGPTYGGERWVSPPTYEILVGEGIPYSIEARAAVYDKEGKPLALNLDWMPEDPEMVTVAPTNGEEVKITIQSEGQTTIKVNAEGLTKILSIKAEYKNIAIRVTISQ